MTPRRIRRLPPTVWLLPAVLLLSPVFSSCGAPSAAAAGQKTAGSPASEDNKRAVLLDGPFRGTGIPFLAPNLLSYSYGHYRFDGLKIDVYFTRLAVPTDAAWVPHNCRGRVLRTIPQSGVTVLYYDNSPQWSLFFRIPASLPDDCPFVATFIDRFVYFYDSIYQQQSYGKTEEIPFPGVLNVQ